nr:MAG TPA: hypothetical protein [Caudoviricetes sp.]
MGILQRQIKENRIIYLYNITNSTTISIYNSIHIYQLSIRISSQISYETA